VLLCAILRHQGRPVRARAGFDTYLEPGFFADHWVCEVWRDDERRWVAVDPGFPPGAGFDFDTLDVPPDRFLVAGRAWQAHRAGDLDASCCGLRGRPDCGPGWIASQVVRDLAALNKLELLCWDSWGLGRTAFAGLSEDDRALLDRVASATSQAGDAGCAWRMHWEEPRLTVPLVVSIPDRTHGAELVPAVHDAGRRDS
jgi:hypothetical protein